MLDMSMKRDLRAFTKLRQRRKKCSLSSTSKLQLHKGFKVSRKPCLNLCSFKWLKRRCNLVKYLTPSGSLTLKINLLLGLIKERSLLLKTSIDSKFCISGTSCNHSDREFGIFEKISSPIEERSLFLACVIKVFTRWYNIEKVLRALS